MTIAIGCDLGGSHLSVGIVRDKTLLASKDLPLDSRKGMAIVLPIIHSTVFELLQRCSLQPSDCLGLALSLPSLIDFRHARVASTNDKFPDAASLDLSSWCRSQFSLTLALENDARAALQGEHYCGAGEEYSDILLLTLGTGIGSAMMINGIPYRTRHVQGGNLGGHIPVALHGRQCTCGALGCMEAEASSWSLPAIAAEWPNFRTSALATEPRINFKALFLHADAGDTIAQQIADHCIHIWSVGAVGLVHAYGPERIIVGGGIMSQAERILPRIAAYVKQHAWTPSGPVSIVPAKLGNHAALHGALPILREYLRGEERANDLR